ncbi:hypothetical protein ABZZ20_06970 [Streptomyces sp. NPDC006430]|uniref:hypothetical protein n=1 Tax=Streptomyces sp. NPDC006430 TaxID=3154299 RepID=UPI0033A96FB8
MTAVNGIYLPGWEYNRMLADDPLEPRNSALPGAVFWNGAAPLWMFEKVYCTKESLENERFAAQELGWATSRIFGQLAAGISGAGPILEPVDWKACGKGPCDLLSQIHVDFRRDNPDRQIRHWIDTANDPELERINCAILQPIATSKQSIVAGSMSGLRHWLSPAVTSPDLDAAGRQEQVRKLLSLISDPISSAQSRNGVQLVRHPRDWDPMALARQDAVKGRVETPFIRDLQAGEGDFAGERGYEPYILNVATERAAYRDVDSPLLADWEQSLPRLLRLRDAASKHLWPKLHSDWLPALLREDPEAVKDFPRYIKSALLSRHFANLLNLNTKQVFGVISAALAAVAVKEPSVREIAAYFSTGSGAVALFSERRIAPNVGPLAVFYQEAFRTLRG